MVLVDCPRCGRLTVLAGCECGYDCKSEREEFMKWLKNVAGRG